jgi:hypothetical protein
MILLKYIVFIGAGLGFIFRAYELKQKLKLMRGYDGRSNK